MAKATLNLNPAQLEKIRPVAIRNGLKTDRQSLVDLAIEIAINSIDNLDDESFQQVNGLKP